MTNEIQRAAAAAAPIDDSDWGSGRQVGAQNRFFDLLKANGWDWEQDEHFASWALKATSEELIARALVRYQEETAAKATKALNDAAADCGHLLRELVDEFDLLHHYRSGLTEDHVEIAGRVEQALQSWSEASESFLKEVARG